jgi:hypothetical protein
LPTSYWAPQRSVTASRLAVSPVTPKGKRYLYAVDEFDWPTASVMSFDVSRDSTSRTPILRPRSTLIPGEQPDRVSFTASVRDVTFVLRDRPEFKDGVALLGQACEPDPSLSGEPGALYRPNVDRSTGARPFKLRGLFAMALLTTGEVSVIDIEDFDAPCRRPVSVNPGEVEDFRGCAGDPEGITSYTLDGGAATVSDEVSCRVVEPHRLRAQRLAITRSDVGTQAPSLRSMPTLSIPTSAQLRDIADRPKLLAIEDLPRVFVGTTEYDPRTSDNDRSPELQLDPTPWACRSTRSAPTRTTKSCASSTRARSPACIVAGSSSAGPTGPSGSPIHRPSTATPASPIPS